MRGRIKSNLQASSAVPVEHDDLRDNTVVMFVDVIGASEVSNHLGAKEYKDFVQMFKDIFKRSCKSYLESWLEDLEEVDDYLCSARGDEGILLIYPKAYREPSILIDIAINIALDLKRNWLLSQQNRTKVLSGIVPIELAVGIHVGQTYLAADSESGKPVKKPEGYAINLAKRVEGFARTGQYTHIFVSEAAHGLLTRLPDERTYLFDEPKSLLAKGFSRDIRAFEVMHHFLPTDWTDAIETPSANPYSKVLLRVPSDDDMRIFTCALKLNPTNVWLAEECIRASMLSKFNSLKKADREKQEKLREAYKDARDIVLYLSQGDQRDPGILMIKGLIHGESFDFEQEIECYKQAREFKRQVSVLDWYHGYALSSQVWYEIGGSALGTNQITKLTVDKIVPRKDSKFSIEAIRAKIVEATRLLSEAAEAAQWSAWIHYTYGCELVMWGDDEAREKGIAAVSRACSLFEDVKFSIAEQEYLAKVRNDPKILSLQK